MKLDKPETGSASKAKSNPFLFQIISRSLVLIVGLLFLWKSKSIESWTVVGLIYISLSVVVYIFLSRKVRALKKQQQDE